MAKNFYWAIAAFLFVYLLRGFGILSFIPGGVVFLLLLLVILTGLMWGIVATMRYWGLLSWGCNS